MAHHGQPAEKPIAAGSVLAAFRCEHPLLRLPVNAMCVSQAGPVMVVAAIAIVAEWRIGGVSPMAVASPNRATRD
jgi:hypothetical protein